jgi:C-terminal processing protease CtpA/Prc
MTFALLLVATLMCSDSPARVQADDATKPVPEKLRVERLARLGKVWGTVRYVHPYLAYQEIDWDAALIKAIPKVEAAKTKDDYVAAIGEMLATLNDPATGVVAPRMPGKPADSERHPDWEWVDGKILVVRITNYLSIEADYLGVRQKVERLKAEIRKAEGVVFDLRALTPGTQPGVLSGVFESIGNVLAAHRAVGPAERSLVHSGYTPQTGMSSGGYFSAFVTTAATEFVPEPGAKSKRVAFVVNARSELPPIALVLQGAGEGALVAEGPISDAIFVTPTNADLGEGMTARIRTTEYVAGPGCPTEIREDVQVAPSTAAGPSIPSYQAAFKFVRGELGLKKAGSASRSPLGQMVSRLDKTYSDMQYPAREYRLLAAFRFWNVIHYFFPYKHLITEGWDGVLEEFIPRLEAARDAREYALALTEMATHTHDSHVFVQGKALTEFFGVSPPGVELREIEGQPVITRVRPDLSKASGVAVGDVILKVDGEPVRERMNKLGKFITGSTPQGHSRILLIRLLGGPPGSRVTLTVRDRDGKERERTLERGAGTMGGFGGGAGEGEVFKLLDGNVGYADLKRLNVAEVDAMFEKFKDTKGIIFDMRGYPRGTAWAIAPRINTKGAIDAADFRRPFVGTSNLSYGSFHFLQPIPDRGGKPLYRGKTVMLIDERAISQSEHTGLFFEAANGTTFIGSPTVGANGDVTTLTLPGGLVVSFSGHDVRHADGRQLQRVGLVPHIEVRPTIQGIREGRDEVLERAETYLKESFHAPDQPAATK